MILKGWPPHSEPSIGRIVKAEGVKVGVLEREEGERGGGSQGSREGG